MRELADLRLEAPRRDEPLLDDFRADNPRLEAERFDALFREALFREALFRAVFRLEELLRALDFRAPELLFLPREPPRDDFLAAMPFLHVGGSAAWISKIRAQ